LTAPKPAQAQAADPTAALAMADEVIALDAATVRDMDRICTLAPEMARALREAVERAKQAEAERDLMRDAGRRLCDNGAVNMHEDGCDETADECACEALRDLRLICNDSDAPGSARAALAEGGK
jgi:hypothetical protein